MDKPVLIIGGGIAGLTVADLLAGNDIRSIIVEREESLGGHVSDWACMATDQCMRCFCCSVRDLMNRAHESEKIQVRSGWELISDLRGDAGAKKVTLKRTDSTEELTLDAAALVLASGFDPYDPAGKPLRLYGRNDNVFTSADINKLISKDMLSEFTKGSDDLSVAFFQCVGSRDAASGANYCSQHCCKTALRMALKLIHELPGVTATIFYIDLQTAGKHSGALLKAAEDKGVHLRQGVPGEIRIFNDSLEVITEHQGLNRRERFDRVILSIGQRPGSAALKAKGWGLSVDEFGFIDSTDSPGGSRSSLEGIYTAGTCSGPKDIEQTIEHAGQTAQAIIADVRKGLLK